MAVDIASVGGGIELWAGGTDGKVRVWKDVGSKSGGMEPDAEWLAHEAEITVGGTALHSTGSVVATASGMRREKKFTPDTECNSESASEDESSEDSDDNSESASTFSRDSASCSTHDEPPEDNSIKIWSLI
jgi:hypothetical protein